MLWCILIRTVTFPPRRHALRGMSRARRSLSCRVRHTSPSHAKASTPTSRRSDVIHTDQIFQRGRAIRLQRWHQLESPSQPVAVVPASYRDALPPPFSPFLFCALERKVETGSPPDAGKDALRHRPVRVTALRVKAAGKTDWCCPRPGLDCSRPADRRRAMSVERQPAARTARLIRRRGRRASFRWRPRRSRVRLGRRRCVRRAAATR